MNNSPGFDAAQRAYDNMAPPEDGPTECPTCNGRGEVPGAHEDDDSTECADCKGFGMIDCNGEPFDPDAADRAADEYADWKRSKA
jgi:DnaJ-class molecular chaperone